MRDVAVSFVANGRAWSRLFGAVRRWFGEYSNLIFQVENSRAYPRLVANRRDCSYFVDIRDVARNRVGRDEIFLSGLCLDFVAIEFGNSAVFLHGADGSREAGLSIQLGRLFNGE